MTEEEENRLARLDSLVLQLGTVIKAHEDFVVLAQAVMTIDPSAHRAFLVKQANNRRN